MVQSSLLTSLLHLSTFFRPHSQAGPVLRKMGKNENWTNSTYPLPIACPAIEISMREEKDLSPCSRAENELEERDSPSPIPRDRALPLPSLHQNRRIGTLGMMSPKEVWPEYDR
ncbi:hypothetical protein BDQ17DRAFT_238174 [Cyathus striatus]|nr:hypothetical protein BDQ17DRAFT_238174 [Cyathus striatus]